MPAPASLRAAFPAPAVPCGLLLAACLLGERDTPREPIVPLAVGNAWTYVDSVFHDGVFVAEDSAGLAVTGTRTVTPGGKAQTVYLWNARNPATGTLDALTLYLQNRKDGNYTVGMRQDTAEFLFETLHVKYPATAGERYPIHFLSFRPEDGGLVPVIDTLEAEVVNADTICAVPAGTFACVHYRGWWPGDVLHADAYYAPGVGYLGSKTVRQEEIDGVERTVTRLHKLKAYALH